MDECRTPKKFPRKSPPNNNDIELKMANSLTFSYCFAGLVIRGPQLSTGAVIAVAMSLMPNLYIIHLFEQISISPLTYSH
jgi:hypothetical protein